MRMRRYQSGFSLVELMVAMALGLLITGAALSLFSTNQRMFQLQQGESELQEQGYLAMRFIVEDVRMAGFHDISVGAAPSPVINASSPSIPASSDGGNSGNDRMTISYHGFRDCEGNPSTSTSRREIINTYWVDDDGQLKCRGNQAVPLTSGVTLLTGVESFQVLYGMDTTPYDQIAFASQYVPADQLSTHFASDHLVLSLKIGMLLKNSAPAIGSGPEKSFYVLDTSKDVDTSQSLFQQFSTTVTLRNYPWSQI